MIPQIHAVRHYFLDTSALVRLYTVEPGSRRVRDLLRSASVAHPTVRLVACELVIPEAASALFQAMNGRDAARRGLGGYARRTLPGQLESDLGPDSRIVFTGVDAVVARAAELVWKHGLRGADAVHVASALALRESTHPRGLELYFVGTDRAQNAAAAAEGLDVLDPTA